ncbi:conserved hypothetical protein [Halorhabdus utahensis DSM 12940]|uniref:DUF7837 domain-containing protein n=1 Tax=Halorhabdus utahensis (strain DSM 12940 / JCM 11049 / AX-2) TaxID=519442 RepID=C7NPE7_HALUD|nr:hypothetical protein [Halorhabdus utahensis]ACV11734.1 conserved hypothetical protein [Halorhabdus utahensis DSM 12940]
MHADTRPVGRCPRCGTGITPERVIIRYERTDGEAMYATCPDCRDVVRPHPAVESTA